LGGRGGRVQGGGVRVSGPIKAPLLGVFSELSAGASGPSLFFFGRDHLGGAGGAKTLFDEKQKKAGQALGGVLFSAPPAPAPRDCSGATPAPATKDATKKKRVRALFWFEGNPACGHRENPPNRRFDWRKGTTGARGGPSLGEGGPRLFQSFFSFFFCHWGTGGGAGETFFLVPAVLFFRGGGHVPGPADQFRRRNSGGAGDCFFEKKKQPTHWGSGLAPARSPTQKNGGARKTGGAGQARGGPVSDLFSTLGSVGGGSTVSCPTGFFPVFPNKNFSASLGGIGTEKTGGPWVEKNSDQQKQAFCLLVINYFPTFAQVGGAEKMGFRGGGGNPRFPKGKTGPLKIFFLESCSRGAIGPGGCSLRVRSVFRGGAGKKLTGATFLGFRGGAAANFFGPGGQSRKNASQPHGWQTFVNPWRGGPAGVGGGGRENSVGGGGDG